VVAAADGVVRSTRRNRLGGNVVWLRDVFGRSHYYAHLDSQAVRRGQRVQSGDTLGFVGNTGNARTTPPHLHFGMYSSGSFDPYPALHRLPTTPASFTGNQDLIGKFVRVNRDGSRIRALPTTRSSILAELELHTPLQVEAGTGVWYRVILPDGTIGFVAERLTEPLDSPIRSETVASAATLLTDPASTAVAVDSVAAGAEVAVLGAFEEFLFVRGPSGRFGDVTVAVDDERVAQVVVQELEVVRPTAGPRNRSAVGVVSPNSLPIAETARHIKGPSILAQLGDELRIAIGSHLPDRRLRACAAWVPGSRDQKRFVA
jgi:hypothetical protein